MPSHLTEITFNQLRINTSAIVSEGAETLLTRPGVAGLIVFQIHDILSPQHGKKNVTNYGPGVEGRETLEKAVDFLKLEPKRLPTHFVIREHVVDEIAADATKKIRAITDNEINRPDDILTSIKEVIAATDLQIARFRA